MLIKNFAKKIPFILQAVLNIALSLLALVLCIMLGKEIVFFIQYAILQKDFSHYKLLKIFSNCLKIF